MAKCCKIKNIRKKADSAMATFLPTDDLKNPLIWIELVSTESKGTAHLETTQI